MISQLSVLSSRGDSIIVRDFRGRGVRGAQDVLFRKVKSSSSTPIIVIEDCCFFYLKRNGLYFIIMIEAIDAPLSLWIDILEAFVRLIKDFCGVLSEDCLRKNFTLVYELVDEVFDYGYPQLLKTGDLTNIIRNEPAGFDPATQGYTYAISNSLSAIGSAGLSSLASLATGGNQGKGSVLRSGSATHNSGPKTVPSNASQAPICFPIAGPATVSNRGTTNHDIFIDIIDRVNLDATVDGQIKSNSTDGMILIKSYLTDPTPLRLGLNEELQVVNEAFDTMTPITTSKFGIKDTCQLDDCLFHESVSLQDFSLNRSLVFTPPQGEFVFMRYRVSPSLVQKPPFLVFADVTISAHDRLTLSVKLTSDNYQKSFCGIAAMTVDLPNWIGSCQTHLIDPSPNQMCDFVPHEHKINWTNRRISMTSRECGFIAKLDVDLDAAPRIVQQALRLGSSEDYPLDTIRAAFPRGMTPRDVINQYLGPILVNFELPMFSSSRIQVRAQP